MEGKGKPTEEKRKQAKILQSATAKSQGLQGSCEVGYPPSRGFAAKEKLY